MTVMQIAMDCVLRNKTQQPKYESILDSFDGEKKGE